MQISCQVAGEASWGFRLLKRNRRGGSVQLNASRDEKDARRVSQGNVRETYAVSEPAAVAVSVRNDEGWKKG